MSAASILAPSAHGGAATAMRARNSIARARKLNEVTLRVRGEAATGIKES
jgi:hypothetical protein